MRVAIMGTGAQGCFFGGVMARADYDVTLIARDNMLETLRKNGIEIKSKVVGDFHVYVKVTDKPSEVRPVDLVFFCVKTYDLNDAAEKMKPLISKDTVVIPVQNGVEAANRISSHIGSGHVLEAVSWVNTTPSEPGVIVNGGSAQILFGEKSGKMTPRVKNLENILLKSGLDAVSKTNILVDVWDKFVFNSAVSGVMALTRLAAGTVRECPETWDLIRNAMAETLTIAQASGISLPPSYVENALERFKTYAPWAKPAMLVDIQAGRRLELDALVGAVVRIGKNLGIPTPIFQVIYAALKPYENGSPSDLTPP